VALRSLEGRTSLHPNAAHASGRLARFAQGAGERGASPSACPHVDGNRQHIDVNLLTKTVNRWTRPGSGPRPRPSSAKRARRHAHLGGHHRERAPGRRFHVPSPSTAPVAENKVCVESVAQVGRFAVSGVDGRSHTPRRRARAVSVARAGRAASARHRVPPSSRVSNGGSTMRATVPRTAALAGRQTARRTSSSGSPDCHEPPARRRWCASSRGCIHRQPRASRLRSATTEAFRSHRPHLLAHTPLGRRSRVHCARHHAAPRAQPGRTEAATSKGALTEGPRSSQGPHVRASSRGARSRPPPRARPRRLSA
jgi:hypothetical protein